LALSKYDQIDHLVYLAAASLPPSFPRPSEACLLCYKNFATRK
jgi:hypothetical protein